MDETQLFKKNKDNNKCIEKKKNKYGKVIIVNCNDPFENRVDFIYNYLIGQSNEVSVIASDFKHSNKAKRTDKKHDFIFIKTKPYYKNLSLARLYSLYQFAGNAFRLVETAQPDLLYVIVPPNSLAKFAARYKKFHPNVKLVFDINDLWPEGMPLGKIKQFLPFKIWGNMRDKNLKAADYIITECNLFHTILRKDLEDLPTSTIHMAQKDEGIESYPVLRLDEIHLCYLGSINHIIDIPTISRMVKALVCSKPVVIHIVGDGENREAFIESIKHCGATVEYYGKIYDPQEIQHIFDKCLFGINMMKKSVCVGLTMKSISYFQAGLPILNNIKGDTAQIVEDYGIGFNVTNENMSQIVHHAANATIPELLDMRKKTRKVFESMFSESVFYEKLEGVMNQI